MNTQVDFKKPGKTESIGLMVMLFSLFALFQASNLYLTAGLHWTTNLTSKIPLPGALMFWLFFILFHVSTMFVMARSILSKSKKSTWNGYDFVVGFLMIVGLYLIAIATIYGVFKGQVAVEFMWNWSYIKMLDVGFIIEAIGMLWYGFTD